ncbi:FGGY family carbohydrate kinase [Bartonella sp. HY329]|uniref:FGGY-family carbohydrate kinase n=1 Tax=unclassified Bartonella TaxID=2645622 RepID=UPI0021CA7770|nr:MULTISPECIES: FGGY family carbohydrate kinase [unclassified Bartonella]UXM94905.1 FGGY family carbohydrate kinase [Bartonella sp. HY329]UXN09228.1 FGGY family carbohydrate kinase [Bartonella sp. HY328]
MTAQIPALPTHHYAAVIDIGKTNCKLAIVDMHELNEVAFLKMANTPIGSGDYRHFDLDGIWDFLVNSLADLYKQFPFGAISITTHAASMVLLGDNDIAMPMLDYEDHGPDILSKQYDLIRPDFSETFSARLPQGLNLGAQIFWLKSQFPKQFAKTKTIVTYPQYWVWKLTGKRVIEMTSLGSHTDLWNPMERKLSSLVDSMDIRQLFPPLHSAFDMIAPISTPLANKLGIDKNIKVYCGIHDSNASILPHLLHQESPFTLLSTGTWVVGFAVGALLDNLDSARDSYANIDAFGNPLATARYMGGREFDIICGPVNETLPDFNIISDNIMAWPSFSGRFGPYPDMAATTTSPLEQLSSRQRYTLASLYSALMSAQCLTMVKSNAPIIIEGPFAHNDIFSQALARITRQPVYCSQAQTGTAIGASLLTGYDKAVLSKLLKGYKIVAPMQELSQSYIKKWQSNLKTAT